MQKKRGPGEQAKRDAVRRVLPGYPAEPFTSKEEIEKYVAGEKIACLMCGKYYRNVLIHSKKIHEMDSEDYRARFNIPDYFPLTGTETRKKLSDHANGLAPEHKAKFREGLARARGLPRKRKPLVPLVRDAWKVALAKAPPQKGEQSGRWVDDDYSWHLEQVATHYPYRDIEPPPGRLSWSGLKKRRMIDPELNARYKQARAKYRSDRAAAQAAEAAIRRQKEKERLAAPRPNRRLYPDSAFDEFLKRMLTGRIPNEVASDPDMPSVKWVRAYFVRHPGSRRRYDETIDAMPFPDQARMQSLGPRFLAEVRRLRVAEDGSKRPDHAIAKMLGLTAMTINIARRKHNIS